MLWCKVQIDEKEWKSPVTLEGGECDFQVQKFTLDDHIWTFLMASPMTESCWTGHINLVHFSGKGSEAFYCSVSVQSLNRKPLSPLPPMMTFPNSLINMLLSASINSVSLMTSSCPVHSVPHCLQPLNPFSYLRLQSVEQKLPMEYVSFPSSATRYGY